MRALFIFALLAAAANAQSAVARITNETHFGSNQFEIGDRYRIEITGAPNQPVSVRTIRRSRMDWGPVIGSTDSSGRWSTSGQFEKSDFGGWNQIWTIGGKLATPALSFSVGAPCLKGGQAFQGMSGPNIFLTCETAAGRQSFTTPSDEDPFRTPDGRLIAGRTISDRTAEQYHAEVIQDMIADVSKPRREISPLALQSSWGGLGDEAAEIITKLVGVNALSDEEIGNVLAIIRAVFAKPEMIAPSAKIPSQSLILLQHLADSTGQDDLKRQIVATMAHLQAQ